MSVKGYILAVLVAIISVLITIGLIWTYETADKRTTAKYQGCYIEYWTEQDSLYISEPNAPIESIMMLTDMINSGMVSDYIFINCEETK